MKQFCVFILVLMFASCEYFNVKKTSSEALLEEELQSFNWNDVDQYPSFSECDSFDTKKAKMKCFQYFLNKGVFEYLQSQDLVVTKDINDTIDLKLQISEKGVIKLIEVKASSAIEKEIPNIYNLLRQSLDSLPEIYPAIKRGQQVKTEFVLPIIINVN